MKLGQLTLLFALGVLALILIMWLHTMLVGGVVPWRGL